MTHGADGIYREALLSADGKHRYVLERGWGLDASHIVRWIMLNPSTADATEDDPTIRRCMAFARSWGYDGMEVVNLYSYRTPSPAECQSWLEANRDESEISYNLTWICRTLDQVIPGALPVAAWGAAPWIDPAHVQMVADHYGDRLHCLGTTASGAPRHPLYVRGDTAAVPWTPPA